MWRGPAWNPCAGAWMTACGGMQGTSLESDFWGRQLCLPSPAAFQPCDLRSHFTSPGLLFRTHLQNGNCSTHSVGFGGLRLRR